MLFTTPPFLFLFLPITFGVFWFLQKFQNLKLSTTWLLLASCAFYFFWNPWDLLPLILAIVVNFSLAKIMILYKDNRRRFIFCLGIFLNLIFLAYYKYFNFFLNDIMHLSTQPVSVTIPLGISFYTFTQIAFLVDCYKCNYAKNDILNYSLFVSYFPHLICGPIISFRELYPQLTNPNKFHVSLKNIVLFVFCFSIGFFKKTYIADALGGYVSQVFDAAPAIHFDQKTCFLAAISYSLQLYFDFSGYSDMAVGLSYLFGLKIPDNFNAPYQSSSIIEFWRRWHISLSLFLKNYLYIPLGGNRTHHYRNISITMLLGGLWHGASWNFVLWGGYQGLLLSLNHLLRSKLTGSSGMFSDIRISFLIHSLKVAVTFILITFGWILFRCSDLERASQFYLSLLGQYGEGISTTTNYLISTPLLTLSFLIVFFMPDTLTLREKFQTWIENSLQKRVVTTAFVTAVLTVCGFMSLNSIQQFLYSGF